MTPCSRAHGKFCSAAHALTVQDYRAARNADEERREREAGRAGTSEYDQWMENNSMITFKAWLQGS